MGSGCVERALPGPGMPRGQCRRGPSCQPSAPGALPRQPLHRQVPPQVLASCTRGSKKQRRACGPAPETPTAATLTPRARACDSNVKGSPGTPSCGASPALPPPTSPSAPRVLRSCRGGEGGEGRAAVLWQGAAAQPLPRSAGHMERGAGSSEWCAHMVQAASSGTPQAAGCFIFARKEAADSFFLPK